jgi:hypothetical protein
VTRQYRSRTTYSAFDCPPETAYFRPTSSMVLGLSPSQMMKELTGDFNVTNWAGWTCLMQASWFGCREHVEALLDARASALVPSTHEFTVPARSTAVDIANKAIRMYIHKPGARNGPADREAILWLISEAAAKEWLALVSHPAVKEGYLEIFYAAVKQVWLNLGGKQLGPPIRRETYTGSKHRSFSSAAKLLCADDFSISLPECLLQWVRAAGKETQGFPVGKHLRYLLFDLLAPVGKLWVYSREDLPVEALRKHFAKYAKMGKLVKVESLGQLEDNSDNLVVDSLGRQVPVEPNSWKHIAFLEFEQYCDSVDAYEHESLRIVEDGLDQQPIGRRSGCPEPAGSGTGPLQLEPLFTMEWSRLGPLRLPPLPFPACAPIGLPLRSDFHFTSLGL